MRFRWVVAVLGVWLCAGDARAADLVVTTTADGVAGSLRAVLADAAAGDRVLVPAGTYTLTQGKLLTRTPVILAGAGPDKTVIRTDGEHRLLDVDAAGT